jgi:GntR family transcriptional repressor for pyruvate dehydrogenase complex
MEVVSHIQLLIKEGRLKPGDRISPERDLSKELKVSRTSLRIGIGRLAEMGVISVRRGVGTFVVNEVARLQASSLDSICTLYGLTESQIFEARIIMESELAALAEWRAKPSHHIALAEAVTGIYATEGSPSEYIIHEIRFHQTIADAAGNPVLAAWFLAVLSTTQEALRERMTSSSASRQTNDLYRSLYKAIRNREAAHARWLLEKLLGVDKVVLKMETPYGKC